MYHDIVTYIGQLRIFLLVSAVGTLLLGAVLLFACRRFSWEGRNRKLIGFFYEMSLWDTVGMACCILKCFLLLSLVLTGGNVAMIHIVMYVVLHLCYILHRRSMRGVAADLGMGVIATAVLLVMSMLYGYLHEILFDGRIACVVVLLGVLLFLYGVCDVFRCCSYVMLSRGKGLHEKKRAKREADHF